MCLCSCKSRPVTLGWPPRSSLRIWKVCQYRSGVYRKHAQQADTGISGQNGDIQMRCQSVNSWTSSLAYLPGMCFNQECQDAADLAFLIVIGLPLLGLVAAIIYNYRPISHKDTEDTFSDPDTGIMFQSEEGAVPECDSKGELAYRPVSYTPWPVEAGEEGERIRIDVGPVERREPGTFIFDRKLPQPSKIFSVTLQRPMGVVFEEDKARKQARVCAILENSPAARSAKLAKLSGWAAAAAIPQPGDVLRAATCTTIVYPSQSLFGAKAPLRTIVVYGADSQSWPKVATALKRGDRRDGDVTLVLERQLPLQA